MSYFNKEALEKFQEMCAEGVDFGEKDPYNFVQCLMPNGDIYGVERGESCDKGKPISDQAAAKIRAGKKAKGKSDTRMAKLKAAFLKKTGREMTDEEKAKALQALNKK